MQQLNEVFQVLSKVSKWQNYYNQMTHLHGREVVNYNRWAVFLFRVSAGHNDHSMLPVLRWGEDNDWAKDLAADDHNLYGSQDNVLEFYDDVLHEHTYLLGYGFDTSHDDTEASQKKSLSSAVIVRYCDYSSSDLERWIVKIAYTYSRELFSTNAKTPDKVMVPLKRSRSPSVSPILPDTSPNNIISDETTTPTREVKKIMCHRE